eukprot:2374856-Amphidinium_carterae.1
MVHRLFDCPRWKHLRPWPEALAAAAPHAQKQQLAQLHFTLPKRCVEPPRELNPCSALPPAPNNVIYTDGAVNNGNHKECRRASLAYVHCVGGHTTFHCEHLLPLAEYPDQTINQAEAYAILQALLGTSGDVHLVTDSKHCHDLFQQLGAADLTDVANGHLWRRIHDIAMHRTCTIQVTIEKVKSHQQQPLERQ